MDNQLLNENAPYKRSRVLYIIEAALEYFIAILMSGAYIAKVTKYLGLSDSLTGIITAFVSLGCGFQAFAILFANKRPIKPWVLIGHCINQLFFTFVYIVPLFDIDRNVRTVVFVLVLLGGHAVNNVINSPKIGWYMSMVDNDKRGSFTATKEIVSLISGLAFSMTIGMIMDHFDAIGDMRSAFLFCGIGIFALTISHTLTLIFTQEKPTTSPKKSLGATIKKLFKNKDLYKIILLFTLYKMAEYSVTPFMGAYEIGDLGLTLTQISIIGAIHAVTRAVASRPMGKLGDKHSFLSAMKVAFSVLFVAYVVNIFTTPSNGIVMITIYFIIYAIALSGTNAGMINLLYDYVDFEDRTSAFAILNSITGVSGFLTSLLMSTIVDQVQVNGNIVFGATIYAPQILSLIAAMFTLVVIILLFTVVKPKNKASHGECLDKSKS